MINSGIVSSVLDFHYMDKNIIKKIFISFLQKKESLSNCPFKSVFHSVPLN